MPAGFDKCRERGGHIVTVKGPSKRYGLRHGEYKHVCIIHGEFHQGEVKEEASHDHETEHRQKHGMHDTGGY